MELLKKVMVYREAEPYEVVETCSTCGSIFKPSLDDILPYDIPKDVIGCYGVVECPVCGNKHICTQGPISDDK